MLLVEFFFFPVTRHFGLLQSCCKRLMLWATGIQKARRSVEVKTNIQTRGQEGGKLLEISLALP